MVDLTGERSQLGRDAVKCRPGMNRQYVLLLMKGFE